jgi:hypothetical protein
MRSLRLIKSPLRLCASAGKSYIFIYLASPKATLERADHIIQFLEDLDEFDDAKYGQSRQGKRDKRPEDLCHWFHGGVQPD